MSSFHQDSIDGLVVVTGIVVEQGQALGARIEELALQLKGRYTIAIVTHNMQQAARISDMTAFFYEGELVEFADTKTLFTRPSQARTEDYITGRFG